MEKSVATNEKVSHIYDDVAFSILSKLSLKSLKRFECVRKSWSLLSKNPFFMNMFCKNFISKCHSYSEGASLTLHLVVPDLSLEVLYSLSGERFEYRTKLELPEPYREEPCFDVCGCASINGILCLDKCDGRVILWNPAIRDFEVIPRSPFECRLHVEPLLNVFGYDRVKDDYKVIRYVVFPSYFDDPLENISLQPYWEVYSLRSNSWKKIEDHIPKPYFDPRCVSVYMAGVCHWLCIDHESLHGHSYTCLCIDHESLRGHSYTCLISFDVSSEGLFKTPIPSDIDHSYDLGVAWSHLVVLNGSIALVTYHERKTTFNFSILGEIGNNKSWTKIFNVGPFTCVEQPIGVGTKAEIFFSTEDGELAWFDLTTQTIQKFGVNAAKYGNQIVIYKGSFVSLKGLIDTDRGKQPSSRYFRKLP